MRTVVDQGADIGEVLLTEDQIQTRVAELGAAISADMAGRQLTLVSVLKGSLPFMADLMRSISVPVRIDLMEVSSYGGATTGETACTPGNAIRRGTRRSSMASCFALLSYSSTGSASSPIRRCEGSNESCAC